MSNGHLLLHQSIQLQLITFPVTGTGEHGYKLARLICLAYFYKRYLPVIEYFYSLCIHIAFRYGTQKSNVCIQ